jgi:hypothetical protein
MTKQDKVFTTLRKLDYIWHKKGYTFCKALKELLGEDLSLAKEFTDDEIIIKIKDICPDEKEK